jgi:putative copper resistance protein D
MTNPTTTATVRGPRLPLLAVLAAGAVAGVLVGLALTATSAVPGIVAPGTAVVVGLPLSRALIDISAVVTVGMSFLPRLIGEQRPRRVERVLAPARRIAVVSAAVWVIAALVSLVLEVADANVGHPVTIGAIEGYVREIGSGQALVIVACCALLYVVIGVLAVRRGEEVPAELRITVAMFTLLPLPVTGHAGTGGESLHDVSLISMELHVLGAVSWTAGLLAVMVLLAGDRALLADALPRFSSLATICVFLVAITGAFNGWYVLYGTPGIQWYVALFTTGYGWILIGKIVCVSGAGVLGAYTRFTLLPRIVDRRATAVLTWATLEIAVLAVAFGLAAVLVRAPVIAS